MMELVVSAGQPVSVDVSGAGPEFLANSALHLGQDLPPVAITLRDDEGSNICCDIQCWAGRARCSGEAGRLF